VLPPADVCRQRERAETICARSALTVPARAAGTLPSVPDGTGCGGERSSTGVGSYPSVDPSRTSFVGMPTEYHRASCRPLGSRNQPDGERPAAGSTVGVDEVAPDVAIGVSVTAEPPDHKRTPGDVPVPTHHAGATPR